MRKSDIRNLIDCWVDDRENTIKTIKSLQRIAVLNLIKKFIPRERIQKKAFHTQDVDYLRNVLITWLQSSGY